MRFVVKDYLIDDVVVPRAVAALRTVARTRLVRAVRCGRVEAEVLKVEVGKVGYLQPEKPVVPCGQLMRLVVRDAQGANLSVRQMVAAQARYALQAELLCGLEAGMPVYDFVVLAMNDNRVHEAEPLYAVGYRLHAPVVYARVLRVGCQFVRRDGDELHLLNERGHVKRFRPPRLPCVACCHLVSPFWVSFRSPSESRQSASGFGTRQR